MAMLGRNLRLEKLPKGGQDLRLRAKVKAFIAKLSEQPEALARCVALRVVSEEARARVGNRTAVGALPTQLRATTG